MRSEVSSEVRGSERGGERLLLPGVCCFDHSYSRESTAVRLGVVQG